MMAQKGKDPAHWNWQVLERSEGHLPKEENKNDGTNSNESDDDLIERAILETDKALHINDEIYENSPEKKAFRGTGGLTTEVITSA